MPVHNSDVARILDRIADLLDIQGANRFRVRAYRNAARTISSLSRNISDMVKGGEDVTSLAGIGKDLAAKIKEIVETGSLKYLTDLQKEIPDELGDMMQIADLGPKRVKTIYEKLKVSSIADLKRAAQENRIQALDGFGEKTETKILEAIERMEKEGESPRRKLVEAEEVALPLVEYLRKVKGVMQAEIAGSYRRRRETVGDLDILVTCRKGSKVMDAFVGYEDVERILGQGQTKSSVVLKSGLQVDLRVLPQVSYGAGLLYFTGSKAHNVALRTMAVKRKIKISEYGAFRGDKRIAGRTEEEMYDLFDLPYIPPELREDRGEIDAALADELPRLVTLDDIRGDLQSHTKASDGKYTLEEMARAAKDKGYEYLAVTDHSKRVSMANGLDEKRLARHIEEVEKLNEKFKGFRVLKSVEVDILKDGSLDLSDSILKELDIVVCSVHYNFNLSRKQQTRRVLKAMENPVFNIFAHPTGRLINEREPYDIDLEEIMREARKNGCFLEVNAQPDRLDLNDIHCKMAKDHGVKVAISTDAHSIDGLEAVKYGIWQARRGWIEADDVINTRTWKQLKKLIKR